MIGTIIVAGITAAVVVVLILGGLAALLEWLIRNPPRRPREDSPKGPGTPDATRPDLFAEAVEESMRRRP